MSLSITTRMLQLVRLPTLLYKPKVLYKLGGENALYITDASFYSCHFSSRELDN